LIHDTHTCGHSKHVLQGQTRDQGRHLREGGHGHTHHDEFDQEGLAGFWWHPRGVLPRRQVVQERHIRTIQTES